MDHGDLIKKAARLLPNSESKYVRDVFMASCETPPPDQDIRIGLAINRLKNKICDFCGSKPNDLFLCGECCSTWYCINKDCKEKDSTKHKTWCCQPNSPRDMGYMATIILKSNGTPVI